MIMDNLIEGIFTLMQNDDEDPIKQSETLEAFYETFDEKTKVSIDIIMTTICGYSLNTIINHPDEIQLTNSGG